MSLAPIVLFVYNRPEHTRKTLQALQQNILAPNSTLHIFADGAKKDASPAVIQRINEVREIIHSQQWCGEVIIHQSNENKGLYQSVRQGVTEIVNQYGKVIVMEDDLQTSPAFLSYMNKALDFYANYQSVFSISGYNYPASQMTFPNDYHYDTYLSLRNCSWGWATWADRWQQIDWDVKSYEVIKHSPAIKAALNRMGDDEFEMLQQRMEQGLNIWSIQFTIAHFLNHAVAIYPVHSYLNNIGNDGSGENCGVSHSLDNAVLSANTNPKFLDILYEDSRIINAFYNIHCRKKRPIWQKIINTIYRSLGKSAPFVIKRKIYE